MKGNHLDLVSESSAGQADAGQRSADGRPFVGVHFTCCDIYLRVYLNREGTRYDGRCPKCGKRVRFRVGPGGTKARFFEAS